MDYSQIGWDCGAGEVRSSSAGCVLAILERARAHRGVPSSSALVVSVRIKYAVTEPVPRDEAPPLQFARPAVR